MAITTSNLSGIVINEIGTNPTGGQLDLNGDGLTNGGDEFIELYNTSGSSVDISGWQVWCFNSGSLMNASAGNLHTFAPGTTLGAGDYIVVADVESGTGAIGLSNAVYMSPSVSSTTYGTPTFMSLFDSQIIVLYDPDTDSYVQFTGEDSQPADQTDVNAQFGSSTLVGSIEFGLEDNIGNSAQRAPDGDTNWVDATQTPGAANMCFCAGTEIATPQGARLVEALQIGDLVHTADGRAVPVLWLGRQTVDRLRHGARMQPVRIRAGALGDAGSACKHAPYRDLEVTADHGMVLDGKVINAAALVNGDTIDFVPTADLGDSFTVFHVETEAHDVILANGAPSETFIDAAGRAAFDNHQEYLDLYGAERLIPEMAAPRITSARLVPQAIKARLAHGLAGGKAGKAA